MIPRFPHCHALVNLNLMSDLSCCIVLCTDALCSLLARFLEFLKLLSIKISCQLDWEDIVSWKVTSFSSCLFCPFPFPCPCPCPFPSPSSLSSFPSWPSFAPGRPSRLAGWLWQHEPSDPSSVQPLLLSVAPLLALEPPRCALETTPAEAEEEIL